MTITTVVRHGHTWNLSDLPARSVALDGAVRGPAVDLAGQRLSLDHHDDCIRLVTSATCQQVLDALCAGWDPSGWTAYVNDVDGDTALSVALLTNPHWADLEIVHDLTYAVGRIDAHGPATRLPGRYGTLTTQFFGVAMAPEVTARRDGTYGTADHAALLEDCVARIEALVAGTLPEAVEGDDARSYTVVHDGAGWVMVSSPDFVFDLVYRDGHTAGVSCQAAGDGSWAYTVARRSDLVDFDVPAILAALAAIEPGWAGGSSIGGAPRNTDGSRSRLTPAQVIDVISDVVAP